MTYELGYTGGPPMAVAPLDKVRQVVDYALTEIPAEKLFLGVPVYGYDWPLPLSLIHISHTAQPSIMGSKPARARSRKVNAGFTSAGSLSNFAKAYSPLSSSRSSSGAGFSSPVTNLSLIHI